MHIIENYIHFFRSKKLVEIMNKNMTMKRMLPHFLHIFPVSVPVCHIPCIYVMFVLHVCNWKSKAEESMKR